MRCGGGSNAHGSDRDRCQKEKENQWKISEVEHLEEGLGEWCRPFLSLVFV